MMKINNRYEVIGTRPTKYYETGKNKIERDKYVLVDCLPYGNETIARTFLIKKTDLKND